MARKKVVVDEVEEIEEKKVEAKEVRKGFNPDLPLKKQREFI